MIQIRRAAVHALYSQPSRCLSTCRTIGGSRVTSFQASKPALYRSFHQTQIWRADEQENKPEEVRLDEVETMGETVPPEPVSQDAEELRDEAAASAEDEYHGSTVGAGAIEPEESSSVKEKVEDFAASAADTAKQATAAAASAVGAPSMAPQQSSSLSSLRNARPTRILYVGNLFFEVTAQQLDSEFARYGEITNSRIVTDARGLSKGFGYVEFSDQEAADRAVQETDQKVFQGRRMAVQYHVRREPRKFGAQTGSSGPGNAPSKTLFIGNMSYQMSDRDLNDLFREIRDVLDVRVAIDRRSGQPRGFAHADFIDVQAAERAKEHLGKKVVYGRQLRVDFSGQSGGNAGVEGA